MQKFIPLILVLALVGFGIAAWKHFGQEPVGDAPAADSRKDGEEESTIPEVQPKRDDTALVPERVTIPKQGSAPVVERGDAEVLQGRTLDESGRPLAGVAIELFRFEYIRPTANSTGRQRIRFDEKTVTDCVSDGEGRYRFAGVFADDIPNGYAIRARKAGYATVLKDNVGKGNIVDFTLERGAVIRGRVLNSADRQPISGVVVEGNLKRDTTDMHRYTRWAAKAETDGEGRFELVGAPSGSFNIYLTHPDFEIAFFGQEGNLTVGAGETFEEDFLMLPGIAVEGLVVDASTKKPIEGAVVVLKDMGIIDAYREVTGAFGAFRMKGLRRGKQTFQIQAPNYTLFQENRDLGENDAEGVIRFELVPAGRASGVVYDGRGNPVANADIFVAENKSFLYQVRGYREAQTDAEGRYEVAGLNNGQRYRIVAAASGFVPSGSADFEAAGGANVEGNIIQLEEGARIQGRVVDKAGVAIPGALVALERPPHPDAWFPPQLGIGQMEALTAVTDDEGAFSYSGLWAGSYKLGAEHQDYIEATDRRFRIDSPHESLNQEFALEEGRTISGRVVDSYGNPVAGATVEALLNRGGSNRNRATTDEEGNYVIRRLRDRPHRVWAYSRDAVATAVDDVPADSSQIDFALEKYGSMTGRFLGRDGEPIRRFTAVVMPLADVEHRGTKVNVRDGLKMIMTHEAYEERDISTSDGSFVLDKVMPGDYYVEFRCEDYRDVEKAGISVGPGQNTDLGVLLAPSGGRLEGRIVLADGTAVLPDEVRIALRPGSGTLRSTKVEGGQRTESLGRSNWRGKTVATQAQGLYSAGGLPGGRVEVELSSVRYCVPKKMEIDLDDGQITRKDFEVQLAASIHLAIKDENGEPVPNAGLQHALLASGEIAEVDGRRVTGRGDVNGEFVIRKIPPGSYRLYMRRQNYETAEVEITVGPGERKRAEVTMRNLIR
ncbi:MAG: carboxypeptidase-like regulatory domain-containing protein [Planctomycetota bacterium]